MSAINFLPEVSIPKGEAVNEASKSFFDKGFGVLHIVYAIFPSLFPKLTHAKLIAQDVLRYETINPNIRKVQDLCKKVGYTKRLDVYQGRSFKAHGGPLSLNPHILLLPDKNLTEVDEFLLTKQISQLKYTKGLKALFWSIVPLFFVPILSIPPFLLDLSLQAYFIPCLILAIIPFLTTPKVVFLAKSMEPVHGVRIVVVRVIFYTTITSGFQITYNLRRDIYQNDEEIAKAIGFEKAIKALKTIKEQGPFNADQSSLSALSLFAFEKNGWFYDPNRFLGPSIEKRIIYLQSVQDKAMKK